MASFSFGIGGVSGVLHLAADESNLLTSRPPLIVKTPTSRRAAGSRNTPGSIRNCLNLVRMRMTLEQSSTNLPKLRYYTY